MCPPVCAQAATDDVTYVDCAEWHVRGRGTVVLELCDQCDRTIFVANSAEHPKGKGLLIKGLVAKK